MDGLKRNVLGVLVDACDYDVATERILHAARLGRHFAVTALAVHGVMEGVGDRALCRQINSFDLVTPDGQPVRWALNLLHGTQLKDRVYGPDLALHVVARAARDRLPIYLYGSTQPTLARLVTSLRERFPSLGIAGYEPSKFRGALDGEGEQIARRISASGARILLVGLGCPKQERFAYAMRPLLTMPVLAVGAAFAYHAGDLPIPPRWMQRHGLEWAWRLSLEPKRLWRRYVLTNPAFLAMLGAQKARMWRAIPPPPATDLPTTFTI
ncbi:MAG TPA: WecB/TagA/CpsF family glycosyltransferase [Candidatus Limnocylindrales bacterium]|nr:WecB/TagA/CpsF family glycosyltransferase [Candidatus Limnocylindrales bacterium]